MYVGGVCGVCVMFMWCVAYVCVCVICVYRCVVCVVGGVFMYGVCVWCVACVCVCV